MLYWLCVCDTYHTPVIQCFVQIVTDLPAKLFRMTLHDAPVYLVHKIWWRQLSQASAHAVTRLVTHILFIEQRKIKMSFKGVKNMTNRRRITEWTLTSTIFSSTPNCSGLSTSGSSSSMLGTISPNPWVARISLPNNSFKIQRLVYQGIASHHYTDTRWIYQMSTSVEDIVAQSVHVLGE